MLAVNVVHHHQVSRVKTGINIPVITHFPLQRRLRRLYRMGMASVVAVAAAAVAAAACRSSWRTRACSAIMAALLLRVRRPRRVDSVAPRDGVVYLIY